MRQTLETLLAGSSPSHLKHLLGEEKYAWLNDLSLLKEDPELAGTYVRDGCFLTIEEDGDDYRASGLVGTIYDDFKIQKWEAKRRKLDLARFLMELLKLDRLEKKLNKNTVKDGKEAVKLCTLEYLGVDLYLAPHAWDSEFCAIERDAGGFSSRTVVITPDAYVPKAYQSRIGNAQHLMLDELWENALLRDDAAPLSFYIHDGRTGKDSYSIPYRVFPGLRPGDAEWGDIRVTFRADRKILLTVHGKTMTYPEEHVYFSRSSKNSKDGTSLSVHLLRSWAHVKRLPKPADSVKKMIQRINEDLKEFFRQRQAFYSVDKEGVYTLRVNLDLDEELRERFSNIDAKLLQEAVSSGLAKVIEACGSLDRLPGKAGAHKSSDTAVSVREQMLN